MVLASPTNKVLGLVLRETLKWHAYLEILSRKRYAVIPSKRRLRRLDLPEESLQLVYNILLVPLLRYEISIWGNGYTYNNLRKVEIIQNDTLRAICGCRDSVSDICSVSTVSIL